MKILITGGAGFVGYHLAKYLAERGDNVVICDNFARGREDADFNDLLSKPNVELVICDLTKTEELEKLGNGYDYVYHLAAINHTGLFYKMPDEILRVGILATINILEWMKSKNKEGKIMFTSSNEAYAGIMEAFGNLPIPTAEGVPLVISDPYNPRWSYAGTKIIGELLFIHYSKINKFRMSIVSPHNFYGPRAGTGHVIPDFIERILKKENPFYIYGSEDTRSFCYIDDAIVQMVAVMETKKTDGETIFLGREKETKIIDLAQTLFNVADYHPTIIIGRPSPKGSVRRRRPDLSKLYALTGIKASVSLEDGLRRTFEWYKKNSDLI